MAKAPNIRQMMKQQMRKEQSKELQRLRSSQQGQASPQFADNPVPLAFFADNIPFNMCARPCCFAGCRSHLLRCLER